MKKQVLKFGLLLFGAFAITLSSCKKDPKVEEENEEEVITTMQLSFVPVGGGDAVTYKFDDPDGPGGSNPTIDQIVLAPAKTYNVTVQLLNKTVNPAEDITTEVAAESAAHRFYYEAQSGLNLTISNLNNDVNGVPLGITSQWTTGAVSTGKVDVTLRHYPGTPPNKATADAIDSNKSSTDITTKDVGGFTVKIQ